MAKVLIGSELGSYSFDTVAQTITFSGFTATLERLLMVTDTTNNTIIYQFNDPLKGGTLTNNVLTLTYNTNVPGFANGDKLQIFYWSEEPQQVSTEDLAMILKRVGQLMERPTTITGVGNVRVDLALNGVYTSAGGTIPVTVTNSPAMGGLGSTTYDPSFIYYTMTRQLVLATNQKIIS